MKSPSSFIAITSEGGLLPADFLHELPDPKTSIEGVTPVAYHLAEGERLNEQINRSWHRLKGCWENFKKAVAEKPTTDPTTTDTRERWLFPLFQELGFGRVTAAKPIEVDGRSYPVSHGWNQVPIHLVGSHADLDCRTPGAIGAAKASPHSLVQSALNASEAHLWGIVSNGLNLRLLRDNVALTRLAYVEFDLQAMFDGDLYSEFFVLWLVCHQSRFEGEKPAQYWLERWKKSAEDKTLRALDDLYPGVKKAIAVLGAGLVSNRANVVLLEKLRTGRLTTQEFYKQVLRVIYRMLFLLVAEDRALLHPPSTPSPPSEGGEGRGEVGDSALRTLDSALEKARRRYRDFYSLARLRALTLYRAGTPHPDLWQVFQLVTAKLGSDTGCPELALPPLGSFLWTAAQSTPDLLDSLISNRHFLEAVHALAFVQDGNVRRAVDYKNLGSEELGSVYQGLLEMHPRINADAGSFELDIAAGNERKTSGSYYTPDSLVQCLLDSTLEPVIAERLAEARAKATRSPKAAKTSPSPPSEGGEGRGEVGSSLTYSQLAEKALLSLKVCDKAAGSGHFIIRAGHRIARHLARVRSGEEEPSPSVYRTALRDVIGHCLYGVDINPMAVELCKVTLWLEAIEPGKPLSFLDHHIRCGNSLLGTTPELISAGLPDETFEAIEGDDKAACASLKKLNRAQREGLRHLFIAEDTAIRERMHQAAAAIDEISDSRPEDIHRKEAAFRNAQQNYDFQKAWDLANLWCAAFVIKKHFASSVVPLAIGDQSSAIAATLAPAATQAGLFGGTEEAPKAKAKKTKAPSHAGSEVPIGITTQHLRDFVEGGELPDTLRAEAKRLADQFQFFHFHLAFPEAFAQGGFDIILGNPPWERMQLEEKQFFAEMYPHIAAASARERKKLIEQLRTENPLFYQLYRNELRRTGSEGNFLRFSGRFPESGQGNLTTNSLFIELASQQLQTKGRAGLIVPSGLATQENQKELYKALVSTGRLRSLIDFENSRPLFPGVHRSYRFCVVTLGGSRQETEAEYAFFLTGIEDLQDASKKFVLNFADLQRLSPNTLSCPAFRDQKDAVLTPALYRHSEIIRNEANGRSPWGWNSWQMLNETHEANELRDWTATWHDEGLLKLYEGKLIHQFDHRFATYVRTASDWDAQVIEPHLKGIPTTSITSRYCVRATVWNERVAIRGGPLSWVIGFRSVARSTDERTSMFAVLPKCAASVSLPLVVVNRSASDVLLLVANLNSFAFDYSARLRATGLSINHFMVHQLPVIAPETFDNPTPKLFRDRVRACSMELIYTAWDLEAFAQDCGWSGPPFRWDEERRFLLRCELDAAFFHLYLGPETEWIKQPEALTKDFPTPRHAVDYILDTFPIVKRKDEAKFNGDYRTKRTILELYDALAESTQTGQAYQSRLAPIPASFRSTHTPRLPQDQRIALDSAEKFLLSFIYGFLHQTHEEATFDLLDSAFHLLRQRDRHADEFAAAIGDAAKSWLSSFNDMLPNKEFLPFLKRLEADKWITADRRTGHLSITEKFPAVPFDAWRNYDISAALRVIAHQPEVAKLVLAQPDTPLASREFQLQKTG